ncbi:MAG: hypothetical protein HFH72_08720 [Lachnospiraceae bacterium]|nr:hypothetical protein [Lachnospiraceae bacterium]
MFWKKKEVQKEKKESEIEEENKSIYCELPILKRRTRHAKTIIDNKLYDTEKAEFISPTVDHRILFVTKKGDYFSCQTADYDHMEQEENNTYSISETAYYDIKPETIEYAMSNIGRYQPEKYIEMFGEVEEA